MNLNKIYGYIILSKPGITCLSTFSSLVGIFLSLELYTFSLSKTLIILLSILLGSSGAASFNMWYDIDIDEKMGNRTNKRPILAGTIDRKSALFFSIILSLISMLMLYTLCNLLSALLMLSAIIFYSIIYTICTKRKLVHNTEIGGLTGSFPPMIGYSAIVDDISFTVFIVSVIIFIWSSPHFWSLAIKNISQYKNASIPMLPVIKGVRITKIYILLYILSLSFITMVPITLLEEKNLGYIYTISILILNTYFIYYAIRLLYNTKYAYKLFKFSIVYLFTLLSSIIMDIIVYS